MALIRHQKISEVMAKPYCTKETLMCVVNFGMLWCDTIGDGRKTWCRGPCFHDFPINFVFLVKRIIQT